MSEIRRAYMKGGSFRAIAVEQGVSHETIRQHLKQIGVTASRRRDRNRLLRESAYYVKYGLTRLEVLALRHEALRLMQSGCSRERTPIGAFISQRRNALSRGVPWKLTLGNWWRIWQESGKWNQRGRKIDNYVMGRHGDSGAYECGNVSVVKAGDNVREYYARLRGEDI